MASPAVTYTFTNGTVADADNVNTNFADIINSLTDGTKDLSISALTAAGSATFNGNVTLGNASSDDITVTGSLSSSIPIKTTNSYDIGSSTLGLAGVYFGNNSQTVRIVASNTTSSTYTFTLPVDGGTNNYVMKTNGSGTTSWVSITDSAFLADASTGGTLSATTQSIPCGSGTKTITSTGGEPLEVERTGSSTNSTMSFTTTSGSVFIGQGTANEFAVGSTSNLALSSNQWFTMNSDGGTFKASNSVGRTLTIQNTYSGASVSASTTVLSCEFPNLSDTTNAEYIRFVDSVGTRVGSVSGASTTTVAYNTSSDARLKKDIVPIKDGIERLKKIVPSYYKFVKGGKESEGFIAQQLISVVPYAVSGDPEGDVEKDPMGIDYGKLTPVLTAALKELLERVEAIEMKLGI